jgi:hypothetical protein
MNVYRQGDVLIRAIAAIPADAKDVTPKGRIVLAHGEVTGHAHAIAEGHAREFSLADATGAVRRFLRVVCDAAQVRHEEHAPIPLPPGAYEIVQQREYTPEEIRNVAD